MSALRRVLGCSELTLFDSVSLRNVTYLNLYRANGFSATLNKKVGRLQLPAGINNVDPGIGFQNGDQIDLGKRLILRAKYPLSREFDWAFYYGRDLDQQPSSLHLANGRRGTRPRQPA